MSKNKDLWRKARIALCSSFLRIINKRAHQLVSLRIVSDTGTKTIDLTNDQARRFLLTIKQETEAEV